VNIVSIPFILFKKLSFLNSIFDIAFLFNQKKTAAKGHRILIESYGDVASSIKVYEYWFRRFRNGDFNVNDKVSSG